MEFGSGVSGFTSFTPWWCPLDLGVEGFIYFFNTPNILYWGIACNPGIKPVSLTSPVLAGGFFTTSATWEATLLSHFLFSNLPTTF